MQCTKRPISKCDILWWWRSLRWCRYVYCCVAYPDAVHVKRPKCWVRFTGFKKKQQHCESPSWILWSFYIFELHIFTCHSLLPFYFHFQNQRHVPNQLCVDVTVQVYSVYVCEACTYERSKCWEMSFKEKMFHCNFRPSLVTPHLDYLWTTFCWHCMFWKKAASRRELVFVAFKILCTGAP